jgi:hypothetical protein
MKESTDVNLYAQNEGALALYNFDNRANLDTFEAVPLDTVLRYRDRAAAVIRAYAIASVVGPDGGER